MPNTSGEWCELQRRDFIFGGMVMRTFGWLICAPALVVVAACGRDKAADDALKNDLALASQAQAYNPQFNPAEAGYAPQNAPQYAPQYTPRAVQTVARQPVYRRPTSTARRSTSSNAGSYPAPAAPVIVEKHTQRDAAIGAAAGAVLGATTSRRQGEGRSHRRDGRWRPGRGDRKQRRHHPETGWLVVTNGRRCKESLRGAGDAARTSAASPAPLVCVLPSTRVPARCAPTIYRSESLSVAGGRKR